MATKTGVFLPDEAEQQVPRKSTQSVRANGDEAKRVESVKVAHADPAKLSEQELKSAIIAAWKKHEGLAKKDLAPMLYWLREKLRAQGARNDLTQDKDRGFGFWVEERLDFSRRTADRWCEWYAVEAGIKPLDNGPKVDPAEVALWEDVLDTHKGKQQIAFNCWVKSAVHAQYQKALTTLQKKFGVKDKKEALVRGVIYAAAVVNSKRGHSRLVGKTTSSQRSRTAENLRRARKEVRHAVHVKERELHNVSRDTKGGSQAGRRKHDSPSTNGHRAGGSIKAMRAAAGR
jgi:hypothetical protein